jgi:hypothetical protein
MSSAEPKILKKFANSKLRSMHFRVTLKINKVSHKCRFNTFDYMFLTEHVVWIEADLFILLKEVNRC